METSAKSNHGIDALFGLVARGPFLFFLFFNSACSWRALAVRALLCPVWASDEVAITGLLERRQRDMSREQTVARSGGPNGNSGKGGRGGNDTIKVCALAHLECCCGIGAHFACGGVWRWEPEQTGPQRHARKVLAAVKPDDKCQFV